VPLGRCYLPPGFFYTLNHSHSAVLTTQIKIVENMEKKISRYWKIEVQINGAVIQLPRKQAAFALEALCKYFMPKNVDVLNDGCP
jgi:hypothetical protein